MKFSRSALFYMKTRACPKYFVRDGRCLTELVNKNRNEYFEFTQNLSPQSSFTF